ncbi:MAG TPA: aminotransferase class I/II-fold pyridoxal phosphate-dependent enzyme [Actinomycetota bacterium]
MKKRRHIATRALGAAVEQVGQEPLAPPIYPAATYAFDDVEEFGRVAESKTSGGYLYSRWRNPTVQALASTVADLMSAEAAACFGSGMGAIHATLATFLASGDHAVVARQVYGGTRSLFAGVLARAGIEAAFVDVTDHGAVEEAFTPRTKVLYAETIGNPTLPVADLDALSWIAKTRAALLVLDTTFTPPTMLRPLEHGADLVIDAATKYLSGHSDVLAGVVAGSAARVEAIRHTQIDTGSVLSPFEAFLVARGLQTLELRTERVCANALALAEWLSRHPRVSSVAYPGLPGHPQHDLAKRLLGDRFGGMLCFEAAGGFEAGKRFLERVEIARAAASLGGTKTLVVHPASVTHTQLSARERAAAGVTDGLIRVSAGIEHAEDLIEDFEAALA